MKVLHQLNSVFPSIRQKKLKHFQTLLLFEEANNYLYANSYFFLEQLKFIVHTKQVQLVSRPFFLLFFLNCYYFYFELGYYNDTL